MLDKTSVIILKAQSEISIGIPKVWLMRISKQAPYSTDNIAPLRISPEESDLS